MNYEILRHEKKDCRNSPFPSFSIFHSIFTALLIYYHENCLYNHGNPYIITKTHRQFPCSYKGFA